MRMCAGWECEARGGRLADIARHCGSAKMRMVVIRCVHLGDWLLELNVRATSKSLSGWVPTCHNVHSVHS